MGFLRIYSLQWTWGTLFAEFLGSLIFCSIIFWSNEFIQRRNIKGNQKLLLNSAIVFFTLFLTMTIAMGISSISSSTLASATITPLITLGIVVAGYGEVAQIVSLTLLYVIVAQLIGWMCAFTPYLVYKFIYKSSFAYIESIKISNIRQIRDPYINFCLIFLFFLLAVTLIMMNQVTFGAAPIIKVMILSLLAGPLLSKSGLQTISLWTSIGIFFGTSLYFKKINSNKLFEIGYLALSWGFALAVVRIAIAI